MSNMSYCRFHNTVLDLEDCLNAMENEEESSESEIASCDELLELCHKIVDDFGDLKARNILTKEKDM